MGNSTSGELLGTVQFYNSTPFILAISIDRRNYVNEPWRSRTTTVEQVSSENPFVEIRALDVTGTHVLKHVSFFTRRHQSWIVSDVEVRLQRSGYPLYVADDWSTETVDDQKHFAWSRATSDPTIYDGIALRQDDEYVRYDDVSAATSSNCFTVYNDSPYFLDIAVEYRPTRLLARSSADKTETRYYRSDPQSTAASARQVSIESGDRYPLVRITAVELLTSGAVRSRNIASCKQVEMYAKSGTAWLVTDECVFRQSGRNQPPYVATVVDITGDEVATTDLPRADRWTRADRLKRYDWNRVEVIVHAVPSTHTGASGHQGPGFKPGVDVAAGSVRQDWVSIELLVPTNVAAATGESRVAETTATSDKPH